MYFILFLKTKLITIERIIQEIMQKLGDSTKIETVEYFSQDYATCFDIFRSNYRDVNTTAGIPVIHSARLWIEGSEPRF